MRRPDDRSLAAVAAAAAGAAAWSLPAAAAAWRPLRGPLGIEDSTSSGRSVALTFDDGPHPRGTPAVLDLLAREGVEATFFLVGEQVQRSGELARELLGAGHEVALHCHRHRHLLRLTPRQARDDLERALSVVTEATGRQPSLYRPPYGVFSFPALRWARARGLRPLLWTHWGRDWEAAITPERIVSLLTDQLTAGSVLLLHDADDYSAPGSWQRTVAALPRVLEHVRRSGLALGRA